MSGCQARLPVKLEQQHLFALWANSLYQSGQLAVFENQSTALPTAELVRDVFFFIRLQGSRSQDHFLSYQPHYAKTCGHWI
jgi:hypothetical protein